MSRQQFRCGIAGEAGGVERRSKVDFAPRLAGVEDCTHIVHDGETVLHLFPAGNVVLNFDGHALQESGELRLRTECRVELVEKAGVGLV